VHYGLRLFFIKKSRRIKISTKAGKKIYRSRAYGPTTKDASIASTRITITDLTCNQTEDNSGADECELRIGCDNHYQSHRREMDNGDVWPLNITLNFSYRVKIKLYDLDDPGFPLYDDHDYLGTILIYPGALAGSNTFDQDGADYTLEWITA